MPSGPIPMGRRCWKRTTRIEPGSKSPKSPDETGCKIQQNMRGFTMNQHDNSNATGVSRRNVLAGAAALGSGMLATRFAAAQGKPVSGGVIRVGFASTPDSLDPQKTVAAAGNQVSYLIFDNLTRLDENNVAHPMLATSWTPEKGGLEWVFELRPGVKFHHGTEFTSADVVATIERAYAPEVTFRAKGAFGPVEKAVAEGPHKVRLILKQPFAEIPVVVAGRWARIIAADAIDTLETAPSGTGPFKFKNSQAGSSVTVEKNPNYWIPGQPYLDGVELVGIKESIAQQAAIRGGNVDILTQIPIETFLSLRNASNIKVFSKVTGQYQVMMTQSNMAPFDNPLVREAFRYIVDRNLLVASALLGQGTVGNDVPLPPGNPMLPELPQHKQDLAKAKELLTKAGINTLDIELWTSSERQPTPKMALAFKEAAAKVGVNVTIRDVPYTEYVSNVSRKKPFYTTQWSAYPTFYERLYLMYRSGANWKYGVVEDAPGLDAILDKMISELDEAKRKELIQEALVKIHKSGERIIPYMMNYVGAASAKVQAYTPPNYDVIDFREVWLS
ncbi:ABC transporter substrate-binding protein [Chelatococcus asaccharovorans]|uniref:ABC transporter substrate-binding protein n=1 Tax=Chelatococcus asaccharovorans TaxID=28210 RepID=UPI0022641B29|nr:ABC transporter substrate-binding protein [Chelatococcus asaccharovorans]